MSDRIMTQVRFKKVLWTCPKCGQEDQEDWNVGGGNEYEHYCSNCGHHFNQAVEAVVKLCMEKENRIRMGKAAREKARTFKPERWVEEIIC